MVSQADTPLAQNPKHAASSQKCGCCVCIYAQLRMPVGARERKICIGQPSTDINWGNSMSLIKWQPFGELDDAFNRLMPGFFSRSGRFGAEQGGKIAWAPTADISETDAEYLIRAELPAVKKEDVRVTPLDQGMITIQRRTQGREGNEGRKVSSRRKFPWRFLAQLLGTGEHRRQGHSRGVEGWCADRASSQGKSVGAEDRQSEGSVVGSSRKASLGGPPPSRFTDPMTVFPPNRKAGARTAPFQPPTHSIVTRSSACRRRAAGAAKR